MELVRIVVFSNTPRSLYKAILRSRAFAALLDWDLGKLKATYDAITCKATRTPLKTGAAYALLLAILHKMSDPAAFDSGRLLWGDQLQEIHLSAHVPTKSATLIWTPGATNSAIPEGATIILP